MVTIRKIVNPTEQEIKSCVLMFHDIFGDDDQPSRVFAMNQREERINFQFEAILRAAAIAGNIYGAFESSMDKVGVPFGDSSDVNIVGVAVWYGPGTDPMATVEEQQAIAFWFDSMPDELKHWWIDYFIPESSIFAKDALGPTLKTESYYLDLLGVHPSVRKRGVAKSLLTPVFDQAKEERVPCVVRIGTSLNRGIYERMGFKTRGEEKLFTSPWADMTMSLMVKDVSHEDETEYLV